MPESTANKNEGEPRGPALVPPTISLCKLELSREATTREEGVCHYLGALTPGNIGVGSKVRAIGGRHAWLRVATGITLHNEPAGKALCVSIER